MLLKFGSIVSSGSGKLGGQFVQSTVHGFQLSTINHVKQQPSSSQYQIRCFNKQIQAGWRALSNSQRSTWNNYEYHGLSGHSLWMKFQFQRLVDELPFLSNPALHMSTYLGSELIRNGQFQSSQFWSFGSGISISNGKCTFVNTTNYLKQSVATVLNNYYKCVVICDSLTQGKFDIKYSTLLSVVFFLPGRILDFNDVHSAGSFFIRPNSGAASGVFSSVSLKQVFNY